MPENQIKPHPKFTICSAIDARPITDDEMCRILFGVNVDGFIQMYKDNDNGLRDKLTAT